MAERAHPPFLNYQPAICRAGRGGGEGRRSSPLSPPGPGDPCPGSAALSRQPPAARLRSFPFPKPSRAGSRRARRHTDLRVRCARSWAPLRYPLYFSASSLKTSVHRVTGALGLFVSWFFFFFSTVFTIFKAFPYVIKPGTLVYL